MACRKGLGIFEELAGREAEHHQRQDSGLEYHSLEPGAMDEIFEASVDDPSFDIPIPPLSSPSGDQARMQPVTPRSPSARIENDLNDTLEMPAYDFPDQGLEAHIAAGPAPSRPANTPTGNGEQKSNGEAKLKQVSI